MIDIKLFFFESHYCYGIVKCLKSLKEIIKFELLHNPRLENLDNFLDYSRQAYDGSDSFGFKKEHIGQKSIREFLTENEFDFSALY